MSQVDAGDSADHGYALMSCTASDWGIKRALQYREKWRFIPLPDDVKEALTLEDKSALLRLLESKAGVPLNEVPIQDEFVARAGSGLGIDTQYGQWLQQVLADGDWLRTSAITSQVKARKKHRADIEYPALVEPVSSTLLRPNRFKLLWAKRWRDPSQHINLKEAMVALSSLKRTARVSSLVGSLKLTLCDNLAVVLAFEKGRSGSPALNRLCRKAASLQAGLGLGWRLRHIESPRNVSDGPSRWFENNRPPEIRWIQFPRAKGSNKTELQIYPLVTTASAQTVQTAPPGLDTQGSKSESLTKVHGVNAPTCSSPRSQGGKPLKAECQPTKVSCHDDNAFCKHSGHCQATHVGMLEVFSGSGHLSEACGKKGVPIAASVDIQHGPHHDLTRHSTQSFLCSVILQCNLFYCHFGTPCTVFSMARKGLKNMFAARAKERVSCELAFYTAKLCEICMSVGTFWSIENPVSSALWEFFPIQQLMQRADVFVVEFPMCAYGAPYRKLTRIVTNLESLCSLQRQCHHFRHRVQLVGRMKVFQDGKWNYMNRTQHASAYPQQLAEVWAGLIARAHGPCHAEKECRANFGGIEEGLRQAKGRRSQHQWFLQDITTKVPHLQQHRLRPRLSSHKAEKET